MRTGGDRRPGPRLVDPVQLQDEYLRRLRGIQFGFGMIGLVVAGGIVGYMLIEGWSFSDSLYMVIARSVSSQGERRLVAAGADRVVSPERIGARSISNSVTRPSTVEFTEIVTAHENLELQLEEVRLSDESQLLGRSIEECNIRRNFGLIVVAILTPEGEMVFNPAPGYRLAAGATLVVLGRRDDLKRFTTAT